MNIYEQLNRIDDNESLSEKYTVNNSKELKQLQESMDEETFINMKTWIEENDPNGRAFAYSGPYADYVDDEYMEAVELYNKDNSTSIGIQTSIQGGYGISEMFDDEGYYASCDFVTECDNFLGFAKEASSLEEFRNMLYCYVGEFASCMEAPEDADDGSLLEATKQDSINRGLAKDYLTVNNIDPNQYLVHHLNNEIVSEIDSIKDNSYDNILFVRKAFNGSNDDIHKLIHIAARLGGIDKLIDTLNSWNTSDETRNYIYAVDPADRVSLIPVSIQDAVQMTQTKQVNIGSRIENPQGNSTQLSLEI